MNITRAIILIILVSTSFSTKAADAPTYLQHRSDFVQQVYSSALIGFTFEQKCNYLSEVDHADYEEQLNFSTEVFRGYLLGTKMVGSVDEALSYPLDMAKGSVRFVSMSKCDSDAEKRVRVGFDTAKNFMALINDELKKEVTQ